MFLRYWLPVCLWMAVIFTASSDRDSAQHSSRIIAPLVRWLFPSADPDTVDGLVFLARKCAHVVEYAVLAWLLWRAIRRPVRNDPRPWNWTQAGLALLAAGGYAVTDEWHQMFVDNRIGTAWDVLLDTTGAALGLLAVRGIRALQAPERGADSAT